MRFAGKTVVLCVTGGIAAYKAADLTSKLHQNGATVHVLMTESATQFIAPMTFETLSGNRAVVDTFDRSFPWEVEHISLAKAADVFVIAPATANVIAKAAHGIADDMVTTTLLATKAPVVVAPAMNTGMYDNPVTQENLLPPVRHRRPWTRFGSCPTTPPAKWVTRSRPAQPCAALTQRSFPDRPRSIRRTVSRAWILFPRGICTTR